MNALHRLYPVRRSWMRRLIAWLAEPITPKDTP